MNKLPDCENCIKKDVCKHAIGRYGCSEIESAVMKIERSSPFDVSVEFTCKSYIAPSEEPKEKPKFTRQEVIDKLKELADQYRLTLFVAENGYGSTDLSVRAIFYDWSFNDKILVLHLDLLTLSSDGLEFVRNKLIEKIRQSMRYSAINMKGESND